MSNPQEKERIEKWEKLVKRVERNLKPLQHPFTSVDVERLLNHCRFETDPQMKATSEALRKKRTPEKLKKHSLKKASIWASIAHRVIGA